MLSTLATQPRTPRTEGTEEGGDPSPPASETLLSLHCAQDFVSDNVSHSSIFREGQK